MNTEMIYVLDNGDKRLATTSEIAQLEIDRLAHQQDIANVQARLALKASAEAKLAALGLTSDDLRALGL